MSMKGKFGVKAVPGCSKGRGLYHGVDDVSEGTAFSERAMRSRSAWNALGKS